MSVKAYWMLAGVLALGSGCSSSEEQEERYVFDDGQVVRAEAEQMVEDLANAIDEQSVRGWPPEVEGLGLPAVVISSVEIDPAISLASGELQSILTEVISSHGTVTFVGEVEEAVLLLSASVTKPDARTTQFRFVLATAGGTPVLVRNGTSQAHR